MAVVIFILLAMLPGEIHTVLGGVRLEPYRIFLIFYALVNIRGVFFSKYERFELLLLLFCFWAMLSYVAVHGSAGIQSGVIRFLEVWVVYFMARNYSLKFGGDGIKKIVMLVSSLFLIMAPLALVESQTGMRYTHIWAASVFGTDTDPFIGENYFRYGVYRSSVSFAHPILYSIVAMAFAPFVWFLFSGLKRGLFSFAYLVAVYTSMTSAGIAMLFINILWHIVHGVDQKIPGTLRRLVYGFMFSFLLMNVVSNQGPIKILMQLIALNPATAYARYSQWQYAWDDVIRNKFIGIGFNEWTRPWWMHHSIDSYWLHMAVTHGLVALLVLAGFWGLLIHALLIKYKSTGDFFRILYAGIVLSIIFAGLTVAFFDRAQMLIYFIVGLIVGHMISLMSQSTKLGKVACRSEMKI